MKKVAIVEYLNKIRPYINLKAICDFYNSENSNNAIDYNNLRVVLNDQSSTRLSEDKLKLFVAFLYKVLYVQIFEAYNFEVFIKKEQLENIIKKHCKEISDELIGEFNFEIPNK